MTASLPLQNTLVSALYVIDCVISPVLLCISMGKCVGSRHVIGARHMLVEVDVSTVAQSCNLYWYGQLVGHQPLVV